MKVLLISPKAKLAEAKTVAGFRLPQMTLAQVAALLLTATAEQPVMEVAPSLKATVPVAPLVTVAIRVTVLP